MAYLSCNPNVSDALEMARDVLIPAMRDDPTHHIMFPAPGSGQSDEVVRWFAETLAAGIMQGRERFFKVCENNNDGLVGFCGWTVYQAGDPEVSTAPGWLPTALDRSGWGILDTQMRAYREAAAAQGIIHHIDYLAVHPSYQRDGVGTILMQRMLHEADRERRAVHVMAGEPSRGVRLCTAHGFTIGGEVRTHLLYPRDKVYSLFRPAKRPKKRPAEESGPGS